jgi:hypothetical protein
MGKEFLLLISPCYCTIVPLCYCATVPGFFYALKSTVFGKFVSSP